MVPLGSPAPLPPASWRFTSPVGMGLRFRLQPLFWSRKHRCWAPLGDSLPSPRLAQAFPVPGSQSGLCEASHRVGNFYVYLRSSTSYQGLVRMALTSLSVMAQPSANRLVQTVQRGARVLLPDGVSFGTLFPASGAARLPLLHILTVPHVQR